MVRARRPPEPEQRAHSRPTDSSKSLCACASTARCTTHCARRFPRASFPPRRPAYIVAQEPWCVAAGRARGFSPRGCSCPTHRSAPQLARLPRCSVRCPYTVRPHPLPALTELEVTGCPGHLQASAFLDCPLSSSFSRRRLRGRVITGARRRVAIRPWPAGSHGPSSLGRSLACCLPRGISRASIASLWEV